METSTPQDTWDHTMGSGGMGYEWWLKVKILNFPWDAYTVPDDWKVSVTADDGDGGRKNVIVNHARVMSAAGKILAGKIPSAPEALKRECRKLVFQADDADFDAVLGDELMQVVVLGEIIFG